MLPRAVGNDDTRGVRLPQIASARGAGGGQQAAMGLALGDASDGVWRVKMPPMLSTNSRVDDVERRAVERTGRTLDKLRVMDLQYNAPLRSELADLRLNEYFDNHGSVRFRRLGLTFAAKQHLQGGEKTTFGSCGVTGRQDSKERTTALSNAKAFFLATSTVERDVAQCKVRSQELYNSVDPSQRLRVDDVLERQLEVVFSEVPECKLYFPRGVSEQDMLPVDVSWETQMREMRNCSIAAQLFSDKGWGAGSMMHWMFSRTEVLILSRITALWSKASRPKALENCMDRPTFCRLILDIGLVDQVKVPYYWAVSLFDSRAKVMCCCSPQVAGNSAVPLVPTVNSWMLVCILDVIIRKVFGVENRGLASRDTRQAFLLGLFDIARYRLPEDVIAESGLQADLIKTAILNGEEIQSPRSRSSSASSSRSRGSSASRGAPGTARGSVDTQPENLAAAKSSVASQPAPAGQTVPIGEELLTSQTLATLLVEPEVLHIVWQHKELFEKLHASYADDGDFIDGNMSYSAFLQFCIDFHLSPSLVSAHFLKNAYESTRCLDALSYDAMLKHRRGHSKLSRDVRAKGQRILVRGSKTGELKTLLEEMDDEKNGGTNFNPKKKVRRSSTSVRRTTQRGSGASSVASNSSSLNASARNAPNRAITTPQRNAPKAKAAPKVEKVEGPQPWADVLTAARAATQMTQKEAVKKQSKKPLPGKFGVSAFIETLCRIAFTYLATYGNNPQVNSTGYIRAVWFVTYLRCVFLHMSEGMKRRALTESAEEAEPQQAITSRTSSEEISDGTGCKQAVHAPLRAAMQLTLKEFDASPPQTDLLDPIVMRPGLPDSAASDTLEMQRRRRSKAAQPQHESLEVENLAPPQPGKMPDSPGSPGSHGSIKLSARRRSGDKAKAKTTAEVAAPQAAKGQPTEPTLCVQDGTCSLCHNIAGPEHWGNPRCAGCSVVDVTKFENHVFRKLLVHEPCAKLHVVAVQPLKIRRSTLTPPPMGMSHSLRKPPPAEMSHSLSSPRAGSGLQSPRKRKGSDSKSVGGLVDSKPDLT